MGIRKRLKQIEEKVDRMTALMLVHRLAEPEESPPEPPVSDFDINQLNTEAAPKKISPIFRVNLGRMEYGEPMWEPCRIICAKGPVIGVECLNDEIPMQHYVQLDSVYPDDRPQIEKLAGKLRSESKEEWGFASDFKASELPTNHV